jgi:hypothetical protein
MYVRARSWRKCKRLMGRLERRLDQKLMVQRTTGGVCQLVSMEEGRSSERGREGWTNGRWGLGR